MAPSHRVIIGNKNVHDPDADDVGRGIGILIGILILIVGVLGGASHC
jgi:hypothetical protein